jgi:hypothetical protein
MVAAMKAALSLLFCLSLAGAAELTGSRTVYLMPMNRGLDQFIANRLTRMHVFHVVTDPAKADTIISDRVGAALGERLNDLLRLAGPPPATTQPATETAKNKAEVSKAMEETPQPAVPPVFGDTVNKAASAGNMATSGHGRGTIFLVDVKSRMVLWSTFERPKDFSPRELDRTAERIVKQLKEDLAGK